jgi:hypothetical protein
VWFVRVGRLVFDSFYNTASVFGMGNRVFCVFEFFKITTH